MDSCYGSYCMYIRLLSHTHINLYKLANITCVICVVEHAIVSLNVIPFTPGRTYEM